MVFKFNTAKAISYANNYKEKANPFYKTFKEEEEGCNFVSQCLLAGCENVARKLCPNWFYENEKDYSKSWVNQEELLKYLLTQSECGPVGRLINKTLVTIGDVVFWNENENKKGVGLVTRVSDNETFFVSKNIFFGENEISLLEKMEVKFVHIVGVKK